VSKTVAQLFYIQMKKLRLHWEMNGRQIALLHEFKYLGLTWTTKLSLKTAVDQCRGQIQKSLAKLRWLTSWQFISTKAPWQYFYPYTFPPVAWILPFFSLLPDSHQQIFQQKLQVGLRPLHRCSFISAHNLYTITRECTPDFYIKRYIQKRSRHAHNRSWTLTLL